MFSKNKIHFEISERKILLRVFDVFFVLLALYLVGIIFDLTYFHITEDNYYWVMVLGFYIVLFGAVFEMYNLQVASNQNQIIKSVILTSSTTVLFYFLTPYWTPVLPSNRMQIVDFFLTILLALFFWRIFYLKYLASHRFVKKVVLVCDGSELEELMTSLESADPHYKIVGYVNSDIENKQHHQFPKIRSITIDKLDMFVFKKSVSELVIASQRTEGITVALYNKLLYLLESGLVIREYSLISDQLINQALNF